MNYLRKFIKGFVGLFIVSFTLLSLNFLIQSCTNDDPYEENMAIDRTVEKDNFLSSLKTAEDKYKINTSGIALRATNSNELDIISAIGGEDNLELIIRDLQPSALNLIRSYGITDAELIEEFGSLDAPGIDEVAMLIIETDNLLEHGHTLDIFTQEDYLASIAPLFGTQMYAQTVGGCLGEAAGIKIIQDAIQGGIKKLGKKGVMKLVRKVASRYLGWVGAAVMVIEFSECMGWTDFY